MDYGLQLGKTIREFSRIELEAWYEAAKLYTDKLRLDRLEDIPYGSLQFRGAGGRYNRDVKILNDRLNNAHGLLMVLNQANIDRSWKALHGGK